MLFLLHTLQYILSFATDYNAHCDQMHVANLSCASMWDFLNQAMHLFAILVLKCNLVWRVLFLCCPRMADVKSLVSSEKKASTKRKANAWCSAVNCSNSDSSNPDISI